MGPIVTAPATAEKPPRLSGAALLAVGAVLLVAAWPVHLTSAEIETVSSPTKTITTGTQQGSFSAAALASDDGSSDATTSTSTAQSETQTATSASALVYGTETNTYANTATNNGALHNVVAANQYGPATTLTASSPTKAARFGVQQGTYSATSVNSADGTSDVMLARAATDDTAPVTRAATANSVLATGWTAPTDAYVSDDVYATATANGIDSAFFGFGLAIPTDATVTAVELRVEWSVAAEGPCLRYRVSDNGGAAWSAATTSASGAIADRVDTFDITADRTWTVAELNSDNFQVSLRSNRCGFSTTTWRIDHVTVRVDFTYNVEHEYVFTVTEPETHWTQIDVADESAANPSCSADIYRPGTTSWVGLGWSLTTAETAHSTSITTSLTQYVNATNEVKVRYRCRGITAPDPVVVDRLALTITYTPYLDTRHEFVYEFTTTRRSTATTLTVSDSSLRVTGNIEVHVYDWSATSWVSLWTITQTAETAHNSGALADAPRYISAATGAIRVRYSSTTSVEGTLPESRVDLLQVSIAYTLHTLDVEYTFTSQIAAASWAMIWVNDSAAAATGATAYLYNFNSASWTALGTSYSASETAHAYVVSAGAPNHGDASNRLRVRYAWSSVQDSTALSVDKLTVTVSGNTAPTLVTFTASDSTASHAPAVLNDDGVDSTTVTGVIEDVNGEVDVVAIEVRLYSSATGATTTYSRTVTAADRAQTLEPAAVDNQVVVWNPTASDDRLSFKFLHVWQMADATSPNFYEFTPAARDSWPATSVFSASKITKTVEAWSEFVANDGVANRVYDATGGASSGSWGQWSAAAGATVVESGSGASKVGRYVKIENVGTGPGTISVSWDGTSFVGQTEAAWTIPIDGVLDFKYAMGPQTDPSQIASWSTSANDADGVLALTIGGGEIAWVWYVVDVPDPMRDQGYAQTFTIA